MHKLLEISYHGTTLAVQIVDEPPKASLLINGLARDQASSQTTNTTLRLSTTVQTDYEWHEFVEAHLSYTDSGIRVQLFANKALLLEETHDRGQVHETR